MTLLVPTFVSCGAIINDTIAFIGLKQPKQGGNVRDKDHSTRKLTQQLKVKKNPTLIYYAIAIHVPTTNVPIKCHICPVVHVQMSGNYISIHLSY